MDYCYLGKSQLKFSKVTLGCMTFTGDSNWGATEEKDSLETVRAALDAGIVSFDTAEGYANGYTEEILGRALGKDRPKAVIADKVSAGNLTREGIFAACEKSLKRLGTDYIDLYQIHWPNNEIPIEETMDALLTLKKEGKIREIGVSNFGPQDMEGILPYDVVASNQLAYNMLYRGIEYSIVPKCIENNIGIITYSSLAQGLLSGKYYSGDEFPKGRARTKIFGGFREGSRHGGSGCEDLAFKAIDVIRGICAEINAPMCDVALVWSLAQPGISTVLAGARTPKQVLENAKASELVLEEEILKKLTLATEDVKAFIGDDADPWAYGRIH